MDFNFIGTIWSLLPPVVAIALALKTKEVYSSLFIGIVLGAILYSVSMGTGFEGFLTHLLNDTVGTGSDAKQYGLIKSSPILLTLQQLQSASYRPYRVGLQQYPDLCLAERMDWRCSVRLYRLISTHSSLLYSCL